MRTRTRPTIVTVIVLAALFGCSPRGPSTFMGIVQPYETNIGPGGSVIVVRGDSVLFEHAFGLASLEEKRPNTPATSFRLASVTKQFTAACILLLRDRGLLSLQQPISDFFPKFSSVGRSVTVHHLLTHTSGLLAYEDLMPDSTTVPVLDRDVLTLVGSVDSAYFAPSTRFRYSNTGYALLALIVEKVSGVSFAEFLRREIFVPLGMESSVAFEEGRSSVPVRAFGYSPDDSAAEGFRFTDQSTTSSVLGDGGIYTSVRDLVNWHRSWQEGTILTPAAVREATTVHATSPDSSSFYGYGWYLEEFNGKQCAYHTGSTIGFRNALFRVPEVSLLVVVLMNRNDGAAEKIGRELLELALE